MKQATYGEFGQEKRGRPRRGCVQGGEDCDPLVSLCSVLLEARAGFVKGLPSRRGLASPEAWLEEGEVCGTRVGW